MAKLLVFFLLLSGTAFSYTISGKTYLTDGSQADVQSACSAAPDNGSITVVIPDGTVSCPEHSALIIYSRWRASSTRAIALPPDNQIAIA